MSMKLNTVQILEAFIKTRLKNADDREKTIRNIKIFYLRTFKNITFRELGEEFNLSTDRARQIELNVARQFRTFLIRNKMEI